MAATEKGFVAWCTEEQVEGNECLGGCGRGGVLDVAEGSTGWGDGESADGFCARRKKKTGKIKE